MTVQQLIDQLQKRAGRGDPQVRVETPSGGYGKIKNIWVDGNGVILIEYRPE